MALSVYTPEQPEFELIRRLIPIDGLDHRAQSEIAARGKVVDVKRGDVLFKQGGRDRDVYYLLVGEIELKSATGPATRVRAREMLARSAVSPALPRRATARLRTRGKVFQIERATLDRVLTEDLRDGRSVVQVSELDQEEDGDWMSQVLGSRLLNGLPPDSIQRFFADLEPVPTAPGDVVVKQGTSGEHLFILAEGQCELVRRAVGGAEELKLAVLHAGAVFGEEALIADAPREATARMLTAGLLMRLPKASFDALVRKAALRSVSFPDAEKLVADGARWLDVRFPDEHERLAIDGSTNVALHLLHHRLPELDQEVRYVLYCDTGARSSSGAFLLAQTGFEVVYLDGGLEDSPLASSRTRTVGVASAGAHPDEKRPAPGTAGSRGRPLATGDPVDGEPAAHASRGAPRSREFLEAELAATGARLESVQARLAEAEQAWASQADEADRQLQATGAQVEAERHRAGETLAAARRLQAQVAEARRLIDGERKQRAALERSLAEARTSAQAQELASRKQLEEALGQTSRQLEAIARAREQTMQWADEERTKFAARAEEAEARLSRATRERQEAESARGAAESALGDALRERRAALDSQGERDESAERALEELRAEVKQARRAGEAELRRQQALEQEVIEAERALRAKEQHLAQERARLQLDLEAHTTRERDLEERLAGEQAGLAGGAKANAEQAEALARQRGEFEAQASETAADFERQRAELAKGEEELRTARDLLEEAVETKATARRVELEVRSEANLRKAVELARRTGEADAVRRVMELRSLYERRMSEQAAQFEDARRRSELEVVRLREDLARTTTRQSEQRTLVELPDSKPAPLARRVLSATQIADIRRRMDEKLREHLRA